MELEGFGLVVVWGHGLGSFVQQAQVSSEALHVQGSEIQGVDSGQVVGWSRLKIACCSSIRRSYLRSRQLQLALGHGGHLCRGSSGRW